MDRKDLIAQNIKALREANNLSQKELASMLHVTRQAVTRWENGQTEPDLDTVIHIAELFGVSLQYLITSQEAIKEVAVIKEVPLKQIDMTDEHEFVGETKHIWNKYWKIEFVSRTIALIFAALLLMALFIMLIVFYAQSHLKIFLYLGLLFLLLFLFFVPVTIWFIKDAKTNLTEKKKRNNKRNKFKD